MTPNEDLLRTLSTKNPGTHLKTRDMMALLGRSRGYICKLCRSGVLPHFKLPDRSYRIDSKAVAQWMTGWGIRPLTKRYRVSFHEAAHAITCLVYGLSFETVEVLSEGDPRQAEALGLVTFAPRELSHNDRYALLVTNAASLAAAVKMRPNAHRKGLIWDGCLSDWAAVVRLAKTLGTSEAWIYSEAKTAVNRCWPAIELVASELDRVGRLDYDTVKGLYSGCAVPPNPIQLQLDFPIDSGGS